MRLRLTIIRHGLPATRILWTVASAATATATATARGGVPASAVASTRVPNVAYGDEGCTIAQLLEDVNQVIPLETAVSNNGDGGGASVLGESDEFGGQWGLEDYVVEVDGFECLHFMHVDGLLRDGDDVVIRSLGLGDLRARRLSGRLQISTDGRRLIDGVPFGRHFLQKSHTSRPPIRIPPRKRRRTMISTGWTGNLHDKEVGSGIFQQTASAPYDNQVALYDEEASLLPSEQGTVIRHPPNLFDDDDDLDDSDSDMGYSEHAAEELAEELEQLRDEAEDTVSIENTTTRGSGRKSRMAHRGPLPTSSPARPSIISTPRTAVGRGPEIEATPKSSKSVRFEADKHISSSQVSDHEDALQLEGEKSVSESESAVSSSDDESSETSSDEDFVGHDPESESEAESESDSESSEDESSTSEEEESESEPEVQKTQKLFTPPGKGSSRTRNSNRRKKFRLRLQKLKSLGELPPEANFDDLKKWEAKHGKQPLTEVKVLEDLRESRAKEQSEIETKRQLLLQVIASGGIDVDGCSEKENIPPRYANGKQNENEVFKSVENEVETEPMVSQVSTEEALAETKGPDEDENPSGVKRRKLDLSSTKRLLFGSLGVRTPKSKKDEDALRNKLEGSRNKYLPKTAETDAAATDEIAVEDEIGDENWEKKIILSATECVFDDIKLATPPFPFYQRWDPHANYEIRQRRNNGRRNRKRKQRDWQDEADITWYDGVAEDADEGDATLNYDDAAAASTVQNGVQPSNVNEDEAEDLPTLPSDPDSLPSLTEVEVTTGAIIAFKQLDMSKATNWQPQVSKYKIAKVNEVLDNGSLNLTLAKRDREIRQAGTVDENGVRTYSGFEMPEHEAVEDDGFRNLSFQDLLEPKLLRSASPQGKQGELVNGNHDESSLRDNSLPPLPVSARGSNAEDSVETDADLLAAATATATVSSQTRLDISNMIHDAGFRSAIDSDLALSMPVPVLEKTASRHDSENAQSQESDSSSSSSEHEFSSSPPEAVVEGQHDFDHHGTADKRDAMDLDEKNGSMAADIDDSGFQMDVGDGGDIDMNGGDDVDDDAGSSDSDSSDDGNSLRQNNDDLSEKNDETGLFETGFEEGAAAENSTAVVHPPSPVPREPTKDKASPAHTIESQKEKEEEKERKTAKLEDKSFLSTTLRDGGDSHLQDSFVTASTDHESQSYSSDYSDAISTVQNPFYERDRLAMQTDERNAEERPSDVNLGSNKPADAVAQHKQPVEKDEQEQDQEQQNDQVDNFNSGRLDQGHHDNINDNASDSSDPDFPSIEVLWASTAPSREPFPPIKTEGDKPSLSGGDKDNNHEPSSLPPPSGWVAGISSSPAFESVPTTGTTNNMPAKANAPSGLAPFSYERGQDQEGNEERSRKWSSSFVPSLDVGSEHEPSSSSHNQSQDSHLEDNINDNNRQQQQREEEEELEEKYDREDGDGSRNNPTPVMIDLTMSSPLVSPVDTGSDEDFAKSQGLPKGPGWVRKNVPSTQRQTRSSTSGGILLSSSPPRQLHGGRRGRQTR